MESNEQRKSPIGRNRRLATNEGYPVRAEHGELDYSGQSIAAYAYQICGALNAPKRILDFFSAVAQDERPQYPDAGWSDDELPDPGEVRSESTKSKEKI